MGLPRERNELGQFTSTRRHAPGTVAPAGTQDSVEDDRRQEDPPVQLAGSAIAENDGSLNGSSSTSPLRKDPPVLPPTINTGLENDPKISFSSSSGWMSPIGSSIGFRKYSESLDHPELEKIVGDAVSRAMNSLVSTLGLNGGREHSATQPRAERQNLPRIRSVSADGDYQQVRLETGRKSGANRRQRDENLGADEATDYYDSELSDSDAELPPLAPRLTRKKVMSAPASTKIAAPAAPIPYAINEDVDITDADKVSKAWKSSGQFPKIDPFLGDTDPRGIRQFYSLVTTTKSYRFANAAEQYFFVYRCLDGKPSRLVDKHMKHYHISQTFSGLLKEM
ncbi:hypothetical protein FOL47_001579 [Perkinsus chesapeaki]|uniref:Uncharacterized protein n=1 Tax=Perkinsus chesapeaki TaxID=330153 RepID=A0A7J6KSS6_PERCH|nr:hypothetical protein FOL47_001579 [Perkinsus chesapeaki]